MNEVAKISPLSFILKFALQTCIVCRIYIVLRHEKSQGSKTNVFSLDFL